MEAWRQGRDIISFMFGKIAPSAVWKQVGGDKAGPRKVSLGAICRTQTSSAEGLR
jgi:hypothetical protein